jgi:uncharacterized small protein (DUF1192 family)
VTRSMPHWQWPWERRQEVADLSLNEVLEQLNATVAVLRSEVERLRAERMGGGDGAGRTERPR